MDITSLRTDIDTIDHEIIDLLGKRMDIVKQIGRLKHAQQLSALDQDRWQQVIEDRVSYAQMNEVPQSVIERIWDIIHQWSLQIESTHESD